MFVTCHAASDYEFDSRVPDDRATQRLLEMADRLHRDRVDELLVELRTAFTQGEAVLRRDRLGGEVHGFVPAVARRIEIDDLDVLRARPGLDVLERDPVDDLDSPAPCRDALRSRDRRVTPRYR